MREEMGQQQGVGDVYSRWTNTCHFDKPDLSWMTCQRIDPAGLTAWKHQATVTWNMRLGSCAMHIVVAYSARGDEALWRNSRFISCKRGKNNNKNRLGYNGVDGSILQSGDDAFKAGNLQSEAISVSPLHFRRYTSPQVIAVCSSQNAINSKEEQTLLKCERGGSGTCNKWPRCTHISWPATNLAHNVTH